jgi:uncharacterized surface protein with fasciclin (FAS1) repeats
VYAAAGVYGFMRSKIITVAATVVGVILGVVVPSAATSSPAAAAATGQLRPRLSPTDAEHPGQSAIRARRRTIMNPEAAGMRLFGPGCGLLPRTGPASRAGIATTSVATALSREPTLSELAGALERAGLTSMLSAARALTVFAPDNAAFDALGAGNLQALLTTRPDLVRLLEFYLVAGRVTPAELARRHVLTTVAGTKLSLVRSGPTFTVNNATVSCGNIQTSNATIYVVDRLVVPAS